MEILNKYDLSRCKVCIGYNVSINSKGYRRPGFEIQSVKCSWSKKTIVKKKSLNNK